MQGCEHGIERIEALLRVAGEKETFDRGRLAGNLLVGQVMSIDWCYLGLIPTLTFLQTSETCTCENFVKLLTEMVSRSLS